MKKQNSYLKWIIAAFILVIIFSFFPLILYFTKFHGTLSGNHTEWSEFGVFYGAIISPAFAILSFVAVMLSINETKKQFTRQDENNTFFSMVDLHNNIVNNMVWIKKEPKGLAAFTEYVDAYDRVFLSWLGTWMVEEVDKNISLYDQTLKDNIKVMLSPYISVVRGDPKWLKESVDSFLKKFMKNLEAHHDNLHFAANRPSQEDFDKDVRNAALLLINNTSPENRIEYFRGASRRFYDQYGSHLNNYFGNIYHILNAIDTFSDRDRYCGIFRSLLTRPELVCLYYNVFSYKSDNKMFGLMIKHNIFTDIFYNEICHQPSKITFFADLIELIKQYQKVNKNRFQRSV